MKIEKLENNKIQVTLTMEDLTLYDIDIKKMTPDCSNLHKFLFDIMESVKEETGFNPYSGQVVVEANYNESGIILLISKLRSVSVSDTKKKLFQNKQFTAKIREKKKRFMFESFENLCTALSMLSEQMLLGTAVFKYEEKWYVINKGSEKAQYILGEYCDKLGESVYTELFLQEHAKLVCEGKSSVEMTQIIKALD